MKIQCKKSDGIDEMTVKELGDYIRENKDSIELNIYRP